MSWPSRFHYRDPVGNEWPRGGGQQSEAAADALLAEWEREAATRGLDRRNRPTGTRRLRGSRSGSLSGSDRPLPLGHGWDEELGKHSLAFVNPNREIQGQ
jgi:hypothetical protein